MPFTPYHFGPALLAKAVLPRRISLLAFSATQVAIDLEPGYYIFVAGESPVHRGVHTFLGAALVGLAVGGAVASLGLAERLAARGAAGSRRLAVAPPAIRSETAPGAAVLGGIVGALLHIALDAVFHSHLRPFRPFWSGDGLGGNPFAGVLSSDALHQGCLIAGVVGILWLLVRPGLWLPARGSGDPALGPADPARGSGVPAASVGGSPGARDDAPAGE